MARIERPSARVGAPSTAAYAHSSDGSGAGDFGVRAQTKATTNIVLSGVASGRVVGGSDGSRITGGRGAGTRRLIGIA